MSETKKKRNIRGIALMGMGLMLLLSAGLLVYFRQAEEQKAEEWSLNMVEALQNQIPMQDEDINHGSVENLLHTFALNDELTLKVEDAEFVGIIEIPAIGLTLPIQASMSDAKLKLSPCRYRGSLTKNNLIVAGHNFPNQFGYFYRLRHGDDVLFTDVDGNVYTYQVTGVETLKSTDVDEMEYGNWDLTLFTCTTGGVDRVTIRCQLY